MKRYKPLRTSASNTVNLYYHLNTITYLHQTYIIVMTYITNQKLQKLQSHKIGSYKLQVLDNQF